MFFGKNVLNVCFYSENYSPSLRNNHVFIKKIKGVVKLSQKEFLAFFSASKIPCSKV